MLERRCGLGVASLPDGKIYAAGGYAGNLMYLNSAEVKAAAWWKGSGGNREPCAVSVLVTKRRAL